MKAFLSRADFIAKLNDCGGSVTTMSRTTGYTVRAISKRKKRFERDGVSFLQAPNPARPDNPAWAYPRQINLELDNGIVIVYSDAHYWPGRPQTLSFKALLKVCAGLKPFAIVANGDMIDGAKISKFILSGWAKQPGMTDEIGEMQTRQGEIVKASPRSKLLRSIGNHDVRLDRFFANQADAFEGMHGTRLKDFLPDWEEAWSFKINETFIKHRFRGGVHAAWNNVLQAGVSIVTGHLHKLEAKPVRGFRDHRVWGIETGTIQTNYLDDAPGDDGPYEYAENNPNHWAEGFVVLTYYKGGLLPPEFCSVEFGKAWFRGQEVK